MRLLGKIWKVIDTVFMILAIAIVVSSLCITKIISAIGYTTEG